MKRRLTLFDKLVLGIVFAGFFVYGGSKPTPPPPLYKVPVEVDVAADTLTVSPDVPEKLRDALYGQRCHVQLLIDGEGWRTISTLPAYDLKPVTVQGVYVSGGRERVRRVRLHWPDAQYDAEGDVP